MRCTKQGRVCVQSLDPFKLLTRACDNDAPDLLYLDINMCTAFIRLIWNEILRQASQGGADNEDRDRVDAFFALLVKLDVKSGAAVYSEEWTD